MSPQSAKYRLRSEGGSMLHVRKSSFCGDLKASNQGFEAWRPANFAIKLFKSLAAAV